MEMAEPRVSLPINFTRHSNTIQNLKKQEEEEHWISEEELCTEGSSDEEKPLHVAKRKGNHKKEAKNVKAQSPLPNCCSSEKTNFVEGNATEEVNLPKCDLDDISWKPKRGSIKLPHFDLSQSTSGTVENVI